MADIRSPGENDLAANPGLYVLFMIMSVPIGETELHVSIAGGRKSIGFYIGYGVVAVQGGGKTGSHTYWWRRPSAKP